jgi:hypothetical protein
MKEYLLLILIISEYPLVFITHKIAPTNMAGPGLDIIAVAVVLLFDIYVVRTIKRTQRNDIFFKLYLIAFGISTFLLYRFIFISSN